MKAYPLEAVSAEIAEAPARTTVFVTHAAPEDNEFALWISSKLAAAGYRVWVDQRRLRGGDDFWDEIDRVLRTHAIKQVVAFTRYITKPGVKKELAIGHRETPARRSEVRHPHPERWHRVRRRAARADPH